jgi:hypothetical protein
MSKLFIGNATKQLMKFSYRTPESGGVRVQDIPIGGQVQLTGDLTTSEIDCIIDQHRKYGLISISEIDRSKAFSGLCYSIDRPISFANLQRAIAKNMDVLKDRGREIRKEAALVVNNGLEAELEETGLGGLAKLEMSVVEEDNPAHPSQGERFAEGLRVMQGEETPPRRGPGRPRKAA